MVDSKLSPPVDEIHDPPPAYSSPVYSSRTSFYEESIASDLELPSQLDDSYIDDGQTTRGGKDELLRTPTEPSPYALAFVERFRRPSMQARIISHNIGVETKDKSPRENLPLDIVVMIIGENIDPFITISKRLVKSSHRVRVAAHAKYGSLISSHGLDFWPIDKSFNSGTFEKCLASLTRQRSPEDMHRIQQSLFDIYARCWQACIARFGQDSQPFVADAIIASPLAHAHIHCAARLSIPLHIMSSIPCSPTEEYAHPFSLAPVDVHYANEVGLSNLLSYAMIEESIWTTILDPINRFRQHVLGMKSLHPDVAGRLMQDLPIPHTYFCSDVLLKRPKDWSDILDIAGYPLDGEVEYKPSKALENILQSTSRLIYFTIDSQKLKNPRHLARIISAVGENDGFTILLSSECRNLIDAGHFENVFLTDGAPDAWIISRVNVVVHDASTRSTALALRYGKPSVTIPFDREQTSRAHAIARVEAGAEPLSQKILSSTSLVKAIYCCLEYSVQEQMSRIRRQVENDQPGLNNAVQAFYRQIDSLVSPCSITQRDLATYQVLDRPELQISAAAAAVLLREQLLKRSEIELISHETYDLVAEGAVKSGTNNAKVYLNAFTSAAHDIATSSDLVSKIPGLQRKAKSDENVRRDVANEIGIGTAKFFGHVALLPFTTTALVVNTVAYGIKTAKSSMQGNSNGYGPYDMESSDLQSSSSSLSANNFKEIPSRSDSGSRHGSAVIQRSSRNNQLIQSIAMLRSERGFQDPRVQQVDFRCFILERFTPRSSSGDATKVP